jgi:hypothetical protein
MTRTQRSLTSAQLAAVSGLFSEALQDPVALVKFLDDPDAALQGAGMDDQSIAQIGEFFYQFKSKLLDALVQYDPW